MISNEDGAGTNCMKRVFHGQWSGEFVDENSLPWEPSPNRAPIKTCDTNVQAEDLLAGKP